MACEFLRGIVPVAHTHVKAACTACVTHACSMEEIVKVLHAKTPLQTLTPRDARVLTRTMNACRTAEIIVQQLTSALAQRRIMQRCLTSATAATVATASRQLTDSNVLTPVLPIVRQCLACVELRVNALFTAYGECIALLQKLRSALRFTAQRNCDLAEELESVLASLESEPAEEEGEEESAAAGTTIAAAAAAGDTMAIKMRARATRLRELAQLQTRVEGLLQKILAEGSSGGGDSSRALATTGAPPRKRARGIGWVGNDRVLSPVTTAGGGGVAVAAITAPQPKDPSPSLSLSSSSLSSPC